jgi:hypothetical protein
MDLRAFLRRPVNFSLSSLLIPDDPFQAATLVKIAISRTFESPE